MIKCPNCGSAAQPKLVFTDDEDRPVEAICKEYECGCGCEFRIIYKVSSIKIIN